jgi:hypothetical protein
MEQVPKSGRYRSGHFRQLVIGGDVLSPMESRRIVAAPPPPTSPRLSPSWKLHHIRATLLSGGCGGGRTGRRGSRLGRVDTKAPEAQGAAPQVSFELLPAFLAWPKSASSFGMLPYESITLGCKQNYARLL